MGAPDHSLPMRLLSNGAENLFERAMDPNYRIVVGRESITITWAGRGYIGHIFPDNTPIIFVRDCHDFTEFAWTQPEGSAPQILPDDRNELEAAEALVGLCFQSSQQQSSSSQTDQQQGIPSQYTSQQSTRQPSPLDSVTPVSRSITPGSSLGSPEKKDRALPKFPPKSKLNARKLWKDPEEHEIEEIEEIE